MLQSLIVSDLFKIRSLGFVKGQYFGGIINSINSINCHGNEVKLLLRKCTAKFAILAFCYCAYFKECVVCYCFDTTREF